MELQSNDKAIVNATFLGKFNSEIKTEEGRSSIRLLISKYPFDGKSRKVLWKK